LKSSLSYIDIDNAEFAEAFRLIQHTNQSLFLTGKAGTGKSTFLKYICENTKKKHIVLAPTGVAAINAGGVTIHSFFKMPFRPILPDDPDLSLQDKRIFQFLRYTKDRIKLIEKAELIIIDEISMVRADMIDFIDKVLRIYSRNMRLPFGGKQMLFVGDLYQLEPVLSTDQKQILSRFYPNAYFFSANVFNQTSLVTIELQKVYRQSDENFIRLLDGIRTNRLSKAELQALNKRYQPVDQTKDDFVITVATRRDVVDNINENRLSELPGEKFVFNGEVQGEFPESGLPTLKELELKENAQIIFLKNDQEKRWYNGSIGKITSITDDNQIIVCLDDGSEHLLEREVWNNIRYFYNEKEKRIEEEILGSYIQYPIRLAWAITIHKSQGLTFDKVVVDLSGGAFAGGQTYVALSRCRSFEGLLLKRPVNYSDIFVNKEIIDFSKQYNNRVLIEKAIKHAQADISYAEALDFFEKRNFKEMLESFFQAIHARYDIEKPLIKRFIRQKLNIISRLEKENRKLRERLNEQSGKYRELSHEFYLMGNECILKLKDSRGAIANFDKALLLDPKNVEALIRKGVTLHDMAEYDDAEKCFQRAVELSPNLFKAVYNRGKNRLEIDNLDGALTDLLKAVSLQENHRMSHELLGDTYSRMGNPEKALFHWNIAHGKM
jgi:tetratricopeptide (TPR) repeat protein